MVEVTLERSETQKTGSYGEEHRRGTCLPQNTAPVGGVKHRMDKLES